MIIYLSALLLISKITSARSISTTYFDGNHKSPWYLVAFGMISSGISAVSLVSIPGNVGNEHLYFFQFILGTIAGYLIIAFWILPIFHKHGLISLYQYLERRFGKASYKTGAVIFLISQSFGAALRLLLSVKILQTAFFDQLGIPHTVTILLVLILIWVYTHRSGIKTIVYTDALQSVLLILVIIISIIMMKDGLNLSFREMISSIFRSPMAKWFDWNWNSGTYIGKQFISGMLITIALVGLDQSMMQKTLTVEGTRDAQKNVITFSLLIAFAQTLFLCMGVLMYLFIANHQIPLANDHGHLVQTDSVYPMLAQNYLGKIGAIAFFIAVIASTFATIDSCITALTTSMCYDIFSIETNAREDQRKIKLTSLLIVNTILFIIVLSFWNSKGAIISQIFTIAGYTYGPLLGLFSLGFLSKVKLKESWVPWICIVAPLITFWLCEFLLPKIGFDAGFINIMINALITIVFLLFIKK